MNPTEEKKIFRSALLTFVGLASIVFVIAIGYCIATENTLATILMSIVMIGVGVFASVLLKSEK